MLQFDPPELKKQIVNAVKEWTDKLKIEPDELIEGIGDLIKEDFDPNEFDDRVITLSTELELYLPEWEDTAVMSYEKFINLTEELRFTELIENRICRSKKRSLIRVQGINEAALHLLHYTIRDAEDDVERELRTELMKTEEKLSQLRREIDLTVRNELARNKISNPDLLNSYSSTVEAARELHKIFRKETQRFYIQNTKIAGHNILCSITSGFTIFGVMIAFKEMFLEEYPPINSEDAFVEIRFDEQISESLEKNIFEAYLFELSSNLRTDFKISPRPDCDEIDLSDEESESHSSNPRLRPLLIGKGMTELLELHNRATASTDLDVQILYFTKVIEYVSQTVIRRQSDEAIRAKLLSPRALQPDASFIIELEKVIKAQQKYEKDKEAIRETVAVCCEAVELARVAPPYLTRLRAILNSKNQKENLEKEKQDALKQFGASLYSTRNEVAHAKANYTPSGDECPEDQLFEFANCAKLAAQQVIRWYQLVPEAARLP